jgi:hypothetical protein
MTLPATADSIELHACTIPCADAQRLTALCESPA